MTVSFAIWCWAGWGTDISLLSGSQANIADILAIAGDTLGDLLDKQQGHTVTDKDIYRFDNHAVIIVCSCCTRLMSDQSDAIHTCCHDKEQPDWAEVHYRPLTCKHTCHLWLRSASTGMPAHGR